jgi:hypothetical protein
MIMNKSREAVGKDKIRLREINKEMKYISKQLYPNRNRYNSLSFEKS